MSAVFGVFDKVAQIAGAAAPQLLTIEAGNVEIGLTEFGVRDASAWAIALCRQLR